jgi:ABC-type dipeptide/oligopeptide/nickel transport system ATPase component
LRGVSKSFGPKVVLDACDLEIAEGESVVIIGGSGTGKSVTLKHIMTHTPGFEEQIKDLFRTDATKLNLGEYLKTHIPARIYPPGTVPAYSNYATAVAGYIVEHIVSKREVGRKGLRDQEAQR